LADIDAPEKRQDFGTVSKQALADYIFTKNIKVEYTKLDRNHRIIGTIWINNENVNLKMVENGFAWHFKKYSTSKLFAKAEIRAKSMKKGLWVQNNVIAPWDFRHKKH
jgi:endonuclease YncB( thermonuclease family)